MLPAEIKIHLNIPTKIPTTINKSINKCGVRDQSHVKNPLIYNCSHSKLATF